MRVHRIDETNWWVESDTVSKTGKQARWTIRRLPHLPGGYLITNRKQVQVSPTGALGRKLLKAIKEAKGE